MKRQLFELNQILHEEIDLLTLEFEIDSKVQSSMQKAQKKFFFPALPIQFIKFVALQNNFLIRMIIKLVFFAGNNSERQEQLNY